MLAPPPKAWTEATRAPTLPRVTRTEPPNSMVSLTGLRATRPRLTRDDRSGGSTFLAAKLRPWRVAITMPMTAPTAARTASSVLLDGSLNALLAPLRPAQAKKITRSTRWTSAPASELTPTAATPADGSTPAFCRNRTFSAMPPTLDGDTRLTYEEAPWVSTVGQNGTRTETPPSSPIALAR